MKKIESHYLNLRSLLRLVKIFIFDKFNLQHSLSNARFWRIQHHFTIVHAIALNLAWIDQLYWYWCRENSFFYLTEESRSIKSNLHDRNHISFSFVCFLFFLSFAYLSSRSQSSLACWYLHWCWSFVYVSWSIALNWLRSSWSQ